jgi:hypothetical protein
VPLRAELRPPPPPPQALPAAGDQALLNKPVKSAAHKPRRPVLATAKPAPLAVPAMPTEMPRLGEAIPEQTPDTAPVPRPVRAPAKPVLAASGTIRFLVYKTSIDVPIGRIEHHWEFSEDGRYTLTGITETIGLAGMFKPLRMVVESSGVLVADGLQPTRFRTMKNGMPTNESADFDWANRTVHLDRDGSVRPVATGTQDLLSLNYQLAYLGSLAEGVQVGVVTGKKYERYALDALGEEELDTPAGHFHTLHLRAMTDNTTEIWIALDRQRLPVKIRFTDKNGDSFEQIVTKMGGEAEATRQTP